MLHLLPYMTIRIDTQAYALFRPRYPDALFDTIFKLMGLNRPDSKGKLVVDVVGAR